MPHDLVQPEPIDEAFITLALSYLENRATTDECDSLGQMLASDPALRRVFNRLAAQLWVLGDERAVANASEAPAAPASATPRRVVRYAMAAAILLAAAAVGIYALIIAGGAGDDAGPSGRPVATLVDATGTVLIGDDLGNVGAEYGSGDVSVGSGSAELLMTNGTSVRLRGSARLRVLNPMRSSLESGLATFNCPPAAVGYTVFLPDGSSVVDLGTRFSVQLAPDGTARVRVLEGRVKVVGPDDNAGERIVEAGSAVYRIGNAWHSDDAFVLAETDGLMLGLDARYGVEFDDQHRVAGWLSSLADEETPVLDARQPDAERRPSVDTVVAADAGRPAIYFGGGYEGGLSVEPSREVDFNFEGSFTVAAWFRVDQFDKMWQALVTKGDSSWRLHRFSDTGKIAFGTTTVGGKTSAFDLASKSELDDGRWHLVVAVAEAERDGLSKRLYVDGRLEAEQRVGPLKANDYPVIVGNNGERPERTWQGWIGAVGVYDRALNDEQIKQMYEAGHRVSDRVETKKDRLDDRQGP